MRLYCLTEGVVDSQLGDIIQVKNDLAMEIVKVATGILDYPEPDVELADTADDNANIYFELGRNKTIPLSQVIMVEVITDEDITIRLPMSLAKAIAVPHDYYKLDSVTDVMNTLEKIQVAIRHAFKLR